jgi:hypothetical protein
VGAACAAVVIGLALLAPPPSAAVSEGAGDSHTSEIGASGCARVSVAPNPNPMKRGAESTAVSVRLDVAPKATATAAPAHGVAHAGSEAPALARWRIAHGTSTASP